MIQQKVKYVSVCRRYILCTTIFKNIFVSHDMYKLKIKGWPCISDLRFQETGNEYVFSKIVNHYLTDDFTISS